MRRVSSPHHTLGERRALAVWSAALAVYLFAIFNRSSLGVAGLMAADRFGIDATRLAFFTVLQLLVYAALQVPVGVLLDRFGPRAVLLAGVALMTAGQVTFALVSSFATAVVARAVIGAGDAMVFISVIRLVTVWFTARQVPLFTQLTGQVGQVGAVIAATPLTFALHTWGWTRAFGAASTLGIVLLVVVALVVQDSPHPGEGPVRVGLAALAGSLRTVWGNPGTRLGMWTHFTAQFSNTVFTLLWGYPFMVAGEGLSSHTASLILVAMTCWSVISGLMISNLVTRFPFRRTHLVVGIVVAMMLAWAALLARSGPAPVAQIVFTVLMSATGGPASMIAFDVARSFSPAATLGRVNGVVNIGGFVASLCAVALIGVVLDRHSHGVAAGAYTLADFRVAMAVQFLFWAVGLVQILRYRHRGLRHLDTHHPGSVDQLRRGEAFIHPGP